MKPFVLLVEDNPDDEMLTLLAFQESRLANPIEVVRDGVEAIEFLEGTGQYAGRDASRLPQLVLLDLNLPRKNGLQVLEWMRGREQTRLIPVVMLTTSNQERDLLESYRLGVNSYVRKPVDFQQFQQAIGQLGMYWLVLNQLPWTAT
ncbi:MAG: response regulator [Candidatus Eremiobacteraeota bacterium]|nr:response regulator [Candidatus Eremiobacteraeota bacterium]MCW5872209.1 response regulator [Candidatus Eremiobacteraeota bacterium]